MLYSAVIYLPGDIPVSRKLTEPGEIVNRNENIATPVKTVTIFPAEPPKSELKKHNKSAISCIYPINAPSVYCPMKNHIVIGIVLKKLKNRGAIIDIGSCSDGFLKCYSSIHDPKAREVNRKVWNNLNVGSVILLAVSRVDQEIDNIHSEELSNPHILSSILSSYQSTYCELTLSAPHHIQKNQPELTILKGDNCFCFEVPLVFCSILRKPECTFIQNLKQKFTNEIVIGANGRIWISSPTPQITLKVVGSILSGINSRFQIGF